MLAWQDESGFYGLLTEAHIFATSLKNTLCCLFLNTGKHINHNTRSFLLIKPNPNLPILETLYYERDKNPSEL